MMVVIVVVVVVVVVNVIVVVVMIVLMSTVPVTMMARYVLAVVPIVADKVDRAAAGMVFSAMP